MVDLSQPFNALIQSNQAEQPNPLVTAGQYAQTKTALAQADDATLQNAQNHINMKINAMAPLLLKGADVAHSDVTSAAAQLVADTKGAVSSSEMGQWVSGLPDGGAPLQQALQGQLFRLQDANSRLATLRGIPVTTNTGATTQMGTRNAFTGDYKPQQGPNGSLTNTLSPEGAASPQTGPVDPTTGAPTTITTGQRAEQAGLAPAGTYTGQGGIPVAIGRDGRIVRRPQAVSPPGAAGGFGSNTSASMPVQTSAGPGQATALKSSGDQYAAAGQNVGTYAQQQEQLASALNGLRNTTTGPGTESRQAIASYMLALPGGIGQYLPGVDPKSIQAYDEANKYLTQTASGSPNAARSDAGLTTALASSPSVHISNAAAQDVLKANIGFRRAEMASYKAFNDSGQDPGTFTKFLAQRQSQIDPRAYSVDLLSEPQRTSFISGLSPAEKAKFFLSVRDAISNGMVDPAKLKSAGAPNGQ